MSQQKLAEITQTHYSNIGRYERGDAKPSAEVLSRIAQALEVSPFTYSEGYPSVKSR